MEDYKNVQSTDNYLEKIKQNNTQIKTSAVILMYALGDPSPEDYPSIVVPWQTLSQLRTNLPA